MPITIPIIAADGAKSTVTAPDPSVGGVQSVNIGETAILVEGDNGNGNLIVAQPVTVTQAGALQTLSFYVTTVGGKLRLGLYSGATLPTTKVAEVAEFTPVAGWNTKPTLTAPALVPGQYWLVYFPQSNSLGFRKAQTGGTSYFKALTYGALPAAFPASPNSTPSHWSFYMNVILSIRDTTAPTVPTNLAGTSPSSSQVNLTWTASTDAVSLAGYYVYRNGVKVGTVSSPSGTSYSDTGLVASTQYTYAVSAFDWAGNTSTQSASTNVTTLAGGGGGLPAGVTLQAIDGETMTDATTMTHNYYSRNGFTHAHNMGWDDIDFFQIGLWRPSIGAQSDANRLLDLGVNVAYGLSNTGALQTSLSVLQSNNIAYVSEGTDFPTSSTADFHVGMLTEDEATTFTVGASDDISSVAAAVQDTRFWYYNGNVYFPTRPVSETGGLSPYAADVAVRTLVTAPGGRQRHLDIISTDLYYFAGSKCPTPISWVVGYAGYDVAGVGRSLTADECARGFLYGDQVDTIRPIQVGYFPAPVGVFIENGGCYSDDTTAASYPYPAEINAAVWSVIIHGGRFFTYFNVTFVGPAGTVWDDLADSYFQTIQSGQTISVYNQAKATSALIAQLASVINSPFALGYVSVSPAGWSKDTGRTNPLSGFDVMAKWDSTNFYIFAMPRYSRNTTNQTATFTIKNTGSTQVTVINESRTIPVTGSGTTFTDTFATGNTVHIYRVD